MNKKTFSFLVVVLGILILLMPKIIVSNFSPYINILGFVILMFGLYKMSTIWVKDTPDENNEGKI